MSEDETDADADPDTEPEQEPEPEADTEAEPEEQESEDTREQSDGAADVDSLDLDGDALDPANDGSEDDTDDDSDGSEDDGDGSGLSSGEWGDMYVAMCTQTTNGIIQKHGDGHEVSEAHFRDIRLDEHFNDVMEKYADSSEMSPEKALIVGTAMAVGGPVALHTDLVSDLAGEFEL